MAKAKELSPLEKIQKDIRAKYGAESVVDFSDESAMKVERLITNSPRMNRVFGGGIPRGRIIEIYGQESSGKCLIGKTLTSILVDDDFHKFLLEEGFIDEQGIYRKKTLRGNKKEI